jgi:putative transposase
VGSTRTPSAVPQPRPSAAPSLREILDAVFYIVCGGCAWRLLPHDFPPWKTAYHYFRLWRLNGTWERGSGCRRPFAKGRESYSGATFSRTPGSRTARASRSPGWAARSAASNPAKKKVKGTKRHLLVDTEGLVMKTKVHSAGIFDREGIKQLMELILKGRFPRLSHL